MAPSVTVGLIDAARAEKLPFWPLHRAGPTRLAVRMALQSFRKAQKARNLRRKLRAHLAPQVGFEPTTLRLTAECSAVELLRNIGMRRRSSLPGRYQPSTFDVLRLNFCVRDGNRWNPQAIAAAKREHCYRGTAAAP